MAGAVTAALLLVHRRLGAIAAVAAAAMALSRVYIGAHYPDDVAAGLMLGATIAWVGYVLLDHLLTRLVQRLAASPLRPLLTTAPVAPSTPDADDQTVTPWSRQVGELVREGQAGDACVRHWPGICHSGGTGMP
jgi:hypothetical protein